MSFQETIAEHQNDLTAGILSLTLNSGEGRKEGRKSLSSPRTAKEEAIQLRDRAWKNIDVPKWANTEGSDLDQFFTKPEVAQKCFQHLQSFLTHNNDNPNRAIYVEPSAGVGAFFDQLPAKRRIGLDVQAFRPEYQQADFLTWNVKKKPGRKYICVGNPPFGYRGWLALAFINHAATFADYVAFIVPMGFQSRGKGNLQDRVKGFRLVHSEPLPADSFCDEAGKTLRVNCLWQIWAKDTSNTEKNKPSCSDFVDLFTVDMRSERLCGQKRLKEASCFLQRTYYTTPPKPVKDFALVKYQCGYGIVIKKDKKRVLKILNSINWNEFSNLASHNCRHISMGHIIEALVAHGVSNG